MQAGRLRDEIEELRTELEEARAEKACDPTATSGTSRSCAAEPDELHVEDEDEVEEEFEPTPEEPPSRCPPGYYDHDKDFGTREYRVPAVFLPLRCVD